MLNTKMADTERAILANGFPFALQQDVEEVIRSLPFDRNVLLADGQIHHIDSLIHQHKQVITLNGETLEIPYRIYFNEPQADEERNLTPLQKRILNCIYLRHHNGFVRQRRLEQLLNSTDYFITPYTFQLLGEYVIEILNVLNKHIHDNTISNYVNFINENPKYWQQTESRMISYWNEYYRRFEFLNLNHYTGKKIVDKIKANTRHSFTKTGS